MPDDNLEKTKKEVASILFFLGEPVSVLKLSRITQKKEQEIKKAVAGLDGHLSALGLQLVAKNDQMLLTTVPEMSEILRKLHKEDLEGGLSKAAVETLSIIIYRGSATRADIDYVRGVDSSFVLRNLAMRGLVERLTYPHDARMYWYKPSFDLLRFLGIKTSEALPRYEEINAALNDFFKNQ